MINLLPQSEKKILRSEEKRKIILILEILVLIFLLCLILILSSVRFYISGLVVAEEIILEQKKKESGLFKDEGVTEKIELANKTFLELESFYESQFKLTKILEGISKIVPERIYLTTLSYQSNNSVITISGFAEKRETLFEFKKSLEGENDLSDPFFPPSTWIKSDDINFNLNLEVNNNETEPQ